jgi:hypothetical protein
LSAAQDMTSDGALFFDVNRTLSFGQAMAFVDAFARMHASAWNSPMFAEGGVMGLGTLAHENRRLVNDVYIPSF